MKINAGEIRDIVVACLLLLFLVTASSASAKPDTPNPMISDKLHLKTSTSIGTMSQETYRI